MICLNGAFFRNNLWHYWILPRGTRGEIADKFFCLAFHVKQCLVTILQTLFSLLTFKLHLALTLRNVIFGKFSTLLSLLNQNAARNYKIRLVISKSQYQHQNLFFNSNDHVYSKKSFVIIGPSSKNKSEMTTEKRNRLKRRSKSWKISWTKVDNSIWTTVGSSWTKHRRRQFVARASRTIASRRPQGRFKSLPSTFSDEPTLTSHD